jgi:hypothetical protein
MMLQSEFASVVVSMTVLEGLARDLDPSIDLVGKLVPFLLGPHDTDTAESLLDRMDHV